MRATKGDNIMAIDVGDKRVGIAIANKIARLPSPLVTLNRGDMFWQELVSLIRENDVATVVVGLPRNLYGEDTAQTLSVRQFISELSEKAGYEAEIQDEALTSVQAEDELRSRGNSYTKSDIDSLAATFILQDFLDRREEPA